MTKRTTNHIQSPPTELMISREKFRSDLSERISLGNQLLNAEIKTENDFNENIKEYHIWNEYNSEYLKQSFNNEYNEYKSSYDNCTDWFGMSLGFKRSSETPFEKLQNHRKLISLKLDNLTRLESRAELLKCNVDSEIKSGDMKIEAQTITKNIFIVHGHDERTKLEVARVIEKLGLNPIILSEKPDEGQTIIEKFELHSDVGYAIILLTADDLGKTKTDSEDKYRARQNVILEMGYFIGKLGRSKVLTLYESGVELPSDLHGIVYTPIDEGGAWKFKLVKELNAAGYVVDANSLL